MIFNLQNPGEHAYLLHGEVGELEAILTVPEQVDSRFFAVLGHPHSLQSGTMNNKVVTTLARSFRDLSIPSIRFNFRGVGLSQGVFDNGMGESKDMMIIAQMIKTILPQIRFFFAGFSFGSYVAYRAAAQIPNHGLITIAPPVTRFDYAEFSTSPKPWLLIQGEDDDVVSFESVERFIADHPSAIMPHFINETGHFFHGKLNDLKAIIMTFIQEQTPQ